MVPTFDITHYGAKSGGQTDCSDAFSQALRHAKENGGGTILVPAGSYLTGPFELIDNTTLMIEREGMILFIADPERYEPVETRWEGIVCHAMHPLIFARKARNVSIVGEGVIDGNGQSWWEAHRKKKASRQTGPVTPIEKRLGALNGSGADQPSGGGGRLSEAGSRGSWPASASSSRAQSSAERAIGPRWSSPRPSGKTPYRLTRP